MSDRDPSPFDPNGEMFFKTRVRVCVFCNKYDSETHTLGGLRCTKNVWAHYFCLLLSTNISQSGKDNTGILGFLYKDIRKEFFRSFGVKCCYCKETNATIYCQHERCKRVFHLPCGLAHYSSHRFTDDFKSYCDLHRQVQKIPHSLKRSLTEWHCTICFIEFVQKDVREVFWPECCKPQGMVHRTCIQKYVISAGYYSKCHLCNNSDIFINCCKKFGIFVPAQDASWEREPNAYSELYMPTVTYCVAETCFCPSGRQFNNGLMWKYISCHFCGSVGVHSECNNNRDRFECDDCLEINRRLAHKPTSIEEVSNDAEEEPVGARELSPDSISEEIEEGTPIPDASDCQDDNSNRKRTLEQVLEEFTTEIQNQDFNPNTENEIDVEQSQVRENENSPAPKRTRLGSESSSEDTSNGHSSNGNSSRGDSSNGNSCNEHKENAKRRITIFATNFSTNIAGSPCLDLRFRFSRISNSQNPVSTQTRETVNSAQDTEPEENVEVEIVPVIEETGQDRARSQENVLLNAEENNNSPYREKETNSTRPNNSRNNNSERRTTRRRIHMLCLETYDTNGKKISCSIAKKPTVCSTTTNTDVRFYGSSNDGSPSTIIIRRNNNADSTVTRYASLYVFARCHITAKNEEGKNKEVIISVRCEKISNDTLRMNIDLDRIGRNDISNLLDTAVDDHLFNFFLCVYPKNLQEHVELQKFPSAIINFPLHI